MNSSSAARSSAAASFGDFLFFDPFLVAGGDAFPLVSDAFASAASFDGAGVFSLSGAPAAAAGGGGGGGDALAAAAAGVFVFLAGGGDDTAAAVGAAFFVEAGGAGAVFLTSFAGAATAGGDAADAAGAALADDEDSTVEVEVEAGEGDGEVTPPLPDADNSLAGGASDVAPAVAADAACESSRASLTRFWDCWYLYSGPRTVAATCRHKMGRGGAGEQWWQHLFVFVSGCVAYHRDNDQYTIEVHALIAWSSIYRGEHATPKQTPTKHTCPGTDLASFAEANKLVPTPTAPLAVAPTTLSVANARSLALDIAAAKATDAGKRETKEKGQKQGTAEE